MNLKFGLDELATEGEHAARIVAVKELGIVKGRKRRFGLPLRCWTDLMQMATSLASI